MCGRVGHIQGNLAQGVCEPVRASARLCAKFCLKGGYQGGRFSDLRSRQKTFPPGACYNILERKAFSRGFLGLEKSSSGGSSSWMTPSSMKMTRLDTSRAKPIS